MHPSVTQPEVVVSTSEERAREETPREALA